MALNRQTVELAVREGGVDGAPDEVCIANDQTLLHVRLRTYIVDEERILEAVHFRIEDDALALVFTMTASACEPPLGVMLLTVIFSIAMSLANTLNAMRECVLPFMLLLFA